MPTPSPKPSSPIPCARSRANTVDTSWPPANNPEQPGPFLPLQALDNIPTAAYLDPHEASQPTVSTSPLQLVDAMRLQTIHDTNYIPIGLRVVDPNGNNNAGNIYAPLPIGNYNTGIAFSIGHGERMQDVYERGVQITGSQRIMGIMFAPGSEHGVVRDLDWGFLAPLSVEEDIHSDTRTEQARQQLEMEMSPVDGDDLKAFRARKEEETKPAETETFEEPEVEDTGIKLHHMIKEMMLGDKKDKENEK